MADGARAPEADRHGRPRKDEPHRPNGGTPTSTGAFADLGALEFDRGAVPDVDLAVDEIEAPAEARVGGTVTVRWRVTNRGTQPPRGPWYDQVSLVADPTRWRIGITLGEVLVSGFRPNEPILLAHCAGFPARAATTPCSPVDSEAMTAVISRTVEGVTRHADPQGVARFTFTALPTVVPQMSGAGPVSCVA